MMLSDETYNLDLMTLIEVVNVLIILFFGQTFKTEKRDPISNEWFYK